MPVTDTPTPRRVALLLRAAWYTLNQTFRRRIAAHGLTPDQFTSPRWRLRHAALRGIHA